MRTTLFLHVTPAALLLSFAFAVGCSTSKTLYVGHRGASGDAPENTVASTRLAYDRGADGAETDIYLTADNQIVCIHDRSTRRTTGVDMNVNESTLAQLESLDAGSWKSPQYAGERIPLLADLLNVIPDGRFLLIEIKTGPQIVPWLEKILLSSGLDPCQTRIISFNYDSCRQAKLAMPRVPVYYLSGFRKDEKTGEWSPTIDSLIEKAKAAHLDGLDLNAAGDAQGPLDLAAARRIHAAGLELHVWTVDDPDVARRMIEIGVDSITTNHPAALRAALAK